ncbi:molybdenum ABC transporter ATP-binding protein [Maribellus maritimus]|uniref:molybdenum ABC transporter ATP-binding protein n=1 Tax=Maribellus maritimus TaxID=2870838 RepID=UPI001EEA38C3|nr:molybdenum ABC transporter ATP-binding protein [Maribellus maritimus]MCG6190357.1 molybdenum ABC transporter ATP-binding protein [Maribellus maritimus]
MKFDIKLQRNGFLFDVEAEIENGITGVYGPSGHGKTSLLNSIAGLVQPDSGFIYINGNTVFNSEQKINLPTRDRKIGYVFQDVRLFPHLSVIRNLKFGINKKSSERINFEELTDILNIKSLLQKKPSECSGGEKQRIAIGRALLSGAQILIMDEPFSAVDVNLRNNIIPFLNTINKRFNIPMLIVSHDLPDLLSLTNHLLLLKDGKVQALGNFQDLILDEANIGIMKGAGLYNVFDLFVFAKLPNRDLVLLKSEKNDFQVQVLCQPFQGVIEIEQKKKVLIRPEDISISLQPIIQISLRNQIKGTIEKIFSKDGLSFCLVNAGEKVLVEITEASRQNMNLDVGTTVFCLFKSAALKIF